MHEIKAFLHFHLTDIKSIADIAQLMNISPETLRRAFYREEKKHLVDYIAELRVAVMKEYLRIGDESCFTICYNVGMREDSGAKLFKKLTGLTMKQYRDRYGIPPTPPII